MRILHINFSNSGVGRYGLLYSKALQDIDSSEVLSVVDRKLLQSGFLHSVIKDTRYSAIAFGTFLEKITAFFRLFHLLCRFRPDIIHDTSGSAVSFSFLYWPLFVLFAPLIVTEHDPKPHSYMGTCWTSKVNRTLLHRLATNFFVHGSKCRQMLIEQGIESERITEIRHGHLLFFDRAAYKKVAKESKSVLCFGALRPNKGVEFLLPVAANANSHFPDVKFIVAGSTALSRELRHSEWSRKLQTILNQMRTLPYFEVHEGFIPDEKVEYFFRRAAITLMPYKDATQSGVAMIAMPFASAIVATNVGDISEVIENNKTGVLCKPQVKEISDALIDLLGNPEKCGRIGGAAREFAIRQCSWEHIVQNALKVYGSFQKDS
jgi:glycosyltransferase involved in cell wall biosynthesis